LNSDDSASTRWLLERAMSTTDLSRRRELIDGKKGDPFEVPYNSKLEISGQ
jgi:hypothetical protein